MDLESLNSQLNELWTRVNVQRSRITPDHLQQLMQEFGQIEKQLMEEQIRLLEEGIGQQQERWNSYLRDREKEVGNFRQRLSDTEARLEQLTNPRSMEPPEGTFPVPETEVPAPAEKEIVAFPETMVSRNQRVAHFIKSVSDLRQKIMSARFTWKSKIADFMAYARSPQKGEESLRVVWQNVVGASRRLRELVGLLGEEIHKFRKGHEGVPGSLPGALDESQKSLEDVLFASSLLERSIEDEAERLQAAIDPEGDVKADVLELDNQVFMEKIWQRWWRDVDGLVADVVRQHARVLDTAGNLSAREKEEAGPLSTPSPRGVGPTFASPAPNPNLETPPWTKDSHIFRQELLHERRRVDERLTDVGDRLNRIEKLMTRLNEKEEPKVLDQDVGLKWHARRLWLRGKGADPDLDKKPSIDFASAAASDSGVKSSENFFERMNQLFLDQNQRFEAILERTARGLVQDAPPISEEAFQTPSIAVPRKQEEVLQSSSAPFEADRKKVEDEHRMEVESLVQKNEALQSRILELEERLSHYQEQISSLRTGMAIPSSPSGVASDSIPADASSEVSPRLDDGAAASARLLTEKSEARQFLRFLILPLLIVVLGWGLARVGPTLWKKQIEARNERKQIAADQSYQKGFTAMSAGHTQEAVQEFENAIEAFPEHKEAKNLLVLSLWNLSDEFITEKKWGEAHQVLRQLEKHIPTDKNVKGLLEEVEAHL